MIRSYPNNALVAYATKGKAYGFAVGASRQALIFNARAFNNSGGAINVGLCQRYAAASYKLWKYVAIGTTFTDVSTAIAAGTASVIFAGANNDAYVVQANQMFSMVGLTISTAQAGGVFTYKYWNGSSFTTLTTLEVPTDYSATGDLWVVFQPPSDWVVGGSTGLDALKYSIQVQSTTAAAAAVSATAIWVANFLEFYKNVPNNAAIQISFPDSKPYLLAGGEGLVPYFSTAHAANQFGAYWAFNGNGS